MALSQDRVELITNLAGQVLQLGREFEIHPPAEVTTNPAVLESDEAAEDLKGTKWWLRFADGREELLTFTELMVLTYNLIVVTQTQARGARPGEIKVSLRMSVPEVMAPANVKALLGTLELVGVRRRQFQPTFPLYGLHQGQGGEKTHLQGCTDPDTRAVLLFVFTETAHAETFANQFGSGTPVLIANSHEEFKEVLRQGPAQFVVFDPVLSGGQLQVTYAVPVPAILGV